jgi:hypothetical protein
MARIEDIDFVAYVRDPLFATEARRFREVVTQNANGEGALEWVYSWYRAILNHSR